MAIKLIALDMDGTLVDSTHVHISDNNIDALKACMDAGIHVVFATGRPKNLMEPLAKKLGIRYAITANGSGVWDIIEEKMLIGRTIPPKWGDKILMLLGSIEGMPLEVYYDGASHVDSRTWDFSNYVLQPRSFLDEREKYNVFHDDLMADALGKEVEKFNIDGMPRKLFDWTVEELKRLTDEEGMNIADQLAINYNAKYENLEISRLDAIKGDALADLCRMLGICSQEVMAFGDSDNDLSMLEFAGESYAVANASASVKEMCKHLTLSNDEDGVAVAIKEAGVI